MSAWTHPVGWFAGNRSEDDEVDAHYPWQPILQDEGVQSPLAVWFATEADCVAFIKSKVIGRGLMTFDHSA
jgi:hypothetical protein